MNIDVGSHIVQGGDEFEVTELLKDGGFGKAFKARQLKPVQREVVVKIPKPNIIGVPDLAKRFEREAQILGNIHHTNVVRIIGFVSFKNPDGSLANMALIQEYVDDAKPLHEYVVQTPLSAASLLLQTLYAMRAFQTDVSPPVLHRDMSPNNILIGRDGLVKVIDFGIAKEDDGASSGLTQVGQWFGTPGCMSPEQCTSFKSVDHRTDLFSAGRSFMAALENRDARFVDLGLLQDPWRTICGRLTEHDAKDRYQTAQEALSAAMALFAAAKIDLFNFGIHVQEHRGKSLTDGWPQMCVAHFEAQPQLTMNDLADAGGIRLDAIRHAGFNARRMFDLFECSEAIKTFEAGTAQFEHGDHLAALYGKLYDQLDDARKLACFGRVCQQAVRLHRYAMMDTSRRIYSSEPSDTIKAKLFAELEKRDPGRVIESRGVFPERK